MNKNQKPLWGIDLGGTKVEGVVIESADNPEVLARIRLPTERVNGYDHIIGQIGKVINLLGKETGLKPEKIGMGTPGIIDPSTGLMKNSNTVVLNHRPFLEGVRTTLKLPVVMTNDANCMALAETLMGSVKDNYPEARVVFGVILGTGVGGGVVIDGKVWNGRMGIGGEWGHNFLDESGGKCYCGKLGCVENVISGPALEAYYHSNGGEKLSLKEIYKRYQSKEPLAINCLERLFHFFPLAISCVLNILDPDVIVLGGGVGNIEELYTKAVPKTADFVFNDKVDTIFLKPKLGDSAGVFGAAYLSLT